MRRFTWRPDRNVEHKPLPSKTAAHRSTTALFQVGGPVGLHACNLSPRQTPKNTEQLCLSGVAPAPVLSRGHPLRRRVGFRSWLEGVEQELRRVLGTT